jgi:hypothetical protein
MALGNRKFGSVFLGGSGDSVVRSCMLPPSILGRCGRCGAQKQCTKLSNTDAETLSGEFFCECGRRVQLSVTFPFRKTGGF